MKPYQKRGDLVLLLRSLPPQSLDEARELLERLLDKHKHLHPIEPREQLQLKGGR